MCGSGSRSFSTPSLLEFLNCSRQVNRQFYLAEFRMELGSLEMMREPIRMSRAFDGDGRAAHSLPVFFFFLS